LCEKIKLNSSPCFYKKNFQILKILDETLFKEFVATFRKPPLTLQIVPEAACESKNVPLAVYDKFIFVGFPGIQLDMSTGEKRPMPEEGILRRVSISIFQNKLVISWK
jgi:hypothetical protein